MNDDPLQPIPIPPLTEEALHQDIVVLEQRLALLRAAAEPPPPGAVAIAEALLRNRHNILELRRGGRFI